MRARLIEAAHGRAVETTSGSPLTPYELGAPWQASVTAMERRVATRLADGDTAAEVGAALNRSLETVKSHMKKLRLKTGCHTITGAVARLIREGVIP